MKLKWSLVAGSTIVLIAVAFALSTKVAYSPALVGKVIDPASGEGVEGAVVVATWLVQSTTNAVPVHYSELQETRTGSGGRFQLSAWGPRIISGGVKAPGTVIRVVHAGHRPLVEHVLPGSPRQNGAVVLSMPKETASPAERADILRFVASSTVAAFFAAPFKCEWRRIPLYLQALRAEDEQLMQQGIATSLSPELSSQDSFGCAK